MHCEDGISYAQVASRLCASCNCTSHLYVSHLCARKGFAQDMVCASSTQTSTWMIAVNGVGDVHAVDSSQCMFCASTGVLCGKMVNDRLHKISYSSLESRFVDYHDLYVRKHLRGISWLTHEKAFAWNITTYT